MVLDANLESVIAKKISLHHDVEGARDMNFVNIDWKLHTDTDHVAGKTYS